MPGELAGRRLGACPAPRQIRLLGHREDGTKHRKGKVSPENRLLLGSKSVLQATSSSPDLQQGNTSPSPTYSVRPLPTHLSDQYNE